MAPDPSQRRRRRVPGWAVPVAIVVVLVAANAAAAAIGPNVPREAGSEERVFIKADQIHERDGATDVVVLGSSESGAGLIPSQLVEGTDGLEGAYNAALVGATFDLQREWATRIVLPQLDPEVVVVGLLPSAGLDLSDTDLDPAEGTAEAYRSAFDQIDPGGLGSISWELRQRSALIRYRPLLRSPSAAWHGLQNTLQGGIEDPTDDDPTMDARLERNPRKVLALTGEDGELLEYRPDTAPGLGNEAAVAAFTAASQLPTDLGPLQDLLEAIEASGAQPVLAIGPVDREVLERDGADLSGLDELDDELQAWAAERGVPTFSVFDQTWPAADFNDRQHLDASGAQRWSEELGAWLAQQCEEGTLGEAC